MNTVWYNSILVILGILILVRNVVFLKNENKLRKNTNESFKGKFWVKKIGIEKTVKLSKRFFLPLGIALSLFLVVNGAWQLFNFI